MTVLSDSSELTVTAIAKHFECTRQSIYTWRKEGMPISDDWAVLESWVSENKSQADDADESLSRQIAKAKLAKLNEEVREKSLNNAVREGELVSAEAVTRFLTSWVNCERAEMEGWANEIITELPGNIRELVFDLISERIRLKLLRLSEMPAEVWMDEAVKDKDV